MRIVSLALVLSCLVLLLYFARNTNMLRDSDPGLDGDKRRPYDLGRVQMAFWFFLILSSYLCLWLVTGDLDTITSPLLSLMGISSATALIAHLIGPSTASKEESVSAGFLTDLLSDSNGYYNFQIFAWTSDVGHYFRRYDLRQPSDAGIQPNPSGPNRDKRWNLSWVQICGPTESKQRCIAVLTYEMNLVPL